MDSTGKVCRVCLRLSDYMVPIFDNGEMSVILNKTIQKHLPIEVTALDILPIQLCYQCASILLSWQELLNNCIESDKILRSKNVKLDNSIVKICQNDNKDDNDIADYRIVQKHLSFDVFYEAQKALRDPTYFSKTCLKRLELSSVNNLIICKNVDGHEKELPFHESDQSQIFKEENLDTCDNFTESGGSAEEESINVNTCRKLNSTVLRKIYKALFNLRSHYEKVHEKKKYRLFLTSDSDLSSDENDESLSDEFKYIANDSPLKYDDLTINNRRRDFFDSDTRQALSRAKTSINGKIYYICPVCGKDLRSTHTYIFHMRIHSGEKPCICHLCGKQFRVNAGLQRHVKETHHKIKMHACDTCGRSFVNRQNLIQHLRIHTGERPYVCPQCGKRFKQSGSLYIHSKTHTDYYPFQCNTCDAKFRQRSGLTHHMYKHTGEKPNICTYCGKAYRVKHELNIHMLMHTDQRPYVCPICGFAFRQRRTMRNHCRKTHDCEIH